MYNREVKKYLRGIMQYNFDEIIPRKESDSVKWNLYPDGVLPFWVADMDFKSPQPVIDALENRVRHGVFGYPCENLELKETICDRLLNLYDWKISLEDIVFLPGVVNGFNLAIRALSSPGQNILMQPPVYHPFLSAPQNSQVFKKEIPLFQDSHQKYQVDFDLFNDAIDDQSKVFLLCNPHNPVGRVFSENELLTMADICLQNDVYICSDEIHADIIFSGNHHIPIASLSPEIAQMSITLMAPSKTFNIAGLGFSFAVVQNKKLRDRLKEVKSGIVPEVNIMGYTAALAAYQHGEEWLTQLLHYLQVNYDVMVKYLSQNLPEIKVTPIEGTYLAWLDCRDLSINQNPYKFFLDEAGIAFNDGKIFGTGGEGYVRFNFGCPRVLMLEGLERMTNSIEQRRHRA